MKRFQWILLSCVLGSMFGCAGSEPAPTASAEDQQKAIAEYDAAIYEQESKNTGP